jgi:Myb-like DNA-binding protein FlbD
MDPMPQHRSQVPAAGKEHRRGPWNSAEDAQLLAGVERVGISNWIVVAASLEARSPKQCRERYHQNLKPTLNHTPITPEEGAQIEHLVATIGKKWADIARRLNNRSDNAVKNWWNGNVTRRDRQSHRRAQRQGLRHRRDCTPLRQSHMPCDASLPSPSLSEGAMEANYTYSASPIAASAATYRPQHMQPSAFQNQHMQPSAYQTQHTHLFMPHPASGYRIPEPEPYHPQHHRATTDPAAYQYQPGVQTGASPRTPLPNHPAHPFQARTSPMAYTLPPPKCNIAPSPRPSDDEVACRTLPTAPSSPYQQQGPQQGQQQQQQQQHQKESSRREPSPSEVRQKMNISSLLG